MCIVDCKEQPRQAGDPDGDQEPTVEHGGSGDRTADSSIRSSLYRWRASGAPLKELEGEETIDVRIRILLNRRRGR